MPEREKKPLRDRRRRGQPSSSCNSSISILIQTKKNSFSMGAIYFRSLFCLCVSVVHIIGRYSFVDNKIKKESKQRIHQKQQQNAK